MDGVGWVHGSQIGPEMYTAVDGSAAGRAASARFGTSLLGREDLETQEILALTL